MNQRLSQRIRVASLLALAANMAGRAAPASSGKSRRVFNLTTPGISLFVDPDSRAKQQAVAWWTSRPNDAATIRKIANHSQADWFGDWVTDPQTEVGNRISTITAAGDLPVLVLYNIPQRDCGLYSAGGAKDSDTYRAWVARVAAGIGDAPAVVILEPDAIAGADCLSTSEAVERYDLIAMAVETLSSLPAVDLYIDAGNASWHPAPEMAERLQRVGVARAAGFALNVSNFIATSVSIAYGRDLSDALGAGGTPFVIDTSRNGNGPWVSDDREAWCNPPGRALGDPPTVDTADPLVHAYLWIKRPGESDGECRGAPPAGAWYPEYALELANNARW